MGFVLLQGLEFGRRERGEALPEYVTGDVSQDNEGLQSAETAMKRKNWRLGRASQRCVGNAGHRWSVPCREGSAGVIAGSSQRAS
jgi:hypothetical protein